ncbi:MAG: hypothetical protein LBJ48_00140 [Coriobacteriales bacterium]|jgi:cell division protein FtsW (lipid II flippase)|nr:hypothetical protein [Coriobacteriales bacterium]
MAASQTNIIDFKKARAELKRSERLVTLPIRRSRLKSRAAAILLVALAVAVSAVALVARFIDNAMYPSDWFNPLSLLVWFVIGLTALACGWALFDAGSLYQNRWWVWGATVLMFWLLWTFGDHYWRYLYLKIGDVHIPSQAFIVMVVVSLTLLVETQRKRGVWGMYFFAVGLMVVAAASVFFSISLSFLTVFVCIVVIGTAVARNHYGDRRCRKVFIVGASIVLLAVASYIIVGTQRVDRLSVFFTDGASDPLDYDYQFQAADMIGYASQLLGQLEEMTDEVFLARSLFGYSDYPFLDIGFVFGRLPSLAVVAACLVTAWLALRASRYDANRYGGLITTGLAATIAFQVLFGILNNYGLTPSASSITVPLGSETGLPLVLHMFMVWALASALWKPRLPNLTEPLREKTQRWRKAA